MPNPKPSTTRLGPSVPDPTPIARALQGHEGLLRLGQLIQASKARYTRVFTNLPGGLDGGLAPFVKPGPIDDEAWTLLAANAAVAAKLRHLQPRIESILEEAGLRPAVVRIKLQKSD